MNRMVPGLMGGKMSSSDPDSKIDFLDPPEAVKRKIKKAFCEEGNITENGLLAFTKAVLIPISQLRIERRKGETGVDSEEGQGAIGEQNPFVDDDAPEGTVFTIRREGKFGGPPSHYKDYQELEDDFAAKKVHPGDLKTAVNKAIDSLLEPIRKAFAESPEWQQVEKLAYPDPNAKAEPKKKKVRRVFCFSAGTKCSTRKKCTIRPHQGGAEMPRQLQSLLRRANHRFPPARILNRALLASSSILVTHECRKHNA